MNIKCPLCNSDRCRANAKYSAVLGLIGNTDSRVYVCAQCGIKFLKPYIEDEQLRELYSEDYFTGFRRDGENAIAPPPPTSYEEFDLKIRIPKFESTMDLILEHVAKPKNMLDVGAASGDF